MDELIVTARNWRTYEAELGAKARNLFLLQEQGISVPTFFALRDCGAAPSPADLAGTLDLQTAADPDGTRYAVRSSGAEEDSADRSFAGLFQTHLFVRRNELASSVEKCRASGSSAQVRAYAGNDPAMPVCVIIQHMVKSVTAGVLFTANPAGALTETVIVAAYGQGEGVVQGSVEADTYVLERQTGTLRTEIARKTAMIEWNEEAGCGTCQRPVAGELAEAAVLSEAEAQSLAALGAEIGRLWPDRFVDIEWCLDAQRRMHIVQCRPITSIPTGEFTVIDNSNIVEGYPGLTGALSFSVLKNAYRKNFSALLRSIGISRARMDGLRRPLEHMTAYIDGRIYYNLTSWYRVMDVVPGCGRWLVPLLDAMIGVTEKGCPGTGLSPAGRMSVRHSMTYAHVALKLLWKFLTLRQAMLRYKRSFAALEDRFRSNRLDSLSNHELVDLWLQVDTRIFRLIHIALFNDLMLMMLVPVMKKLLARTGFEGAESLFNALMCGEERMESVLPLRSIIGLSEKVQSHPGLAQALRTAASSRRKSDLDAALAVSPDFAKKFSAHLQRYGDRLPEELKLETISFRENPLLLADTVLRQTDTGMTVAGLREREQSVRRDAEATLSGGLVGHTLQQRIIGYLLNRTRESLANREGARLDRARFIGFLRSLAHSLGGNLAREGVLAEAGDINHLTFDEAKDYIMGSALETDFMGLVGRRKASLRVAQEHNPAERMLLRGTVYRNFIVQSVPARQAGAAGPDSGALRLCGTPCSPGLVVAEAVVIENPALAPPVAGKIIVARMTDPGWVFLMAAAAGLIVEKGSLLTHTAIIGRELGIPTIVGVAGAVGLITTGSRIRMDGTTGKIELNT